MEMNSLRIEELNSLLNKRRNEIVNLKERTKSLIGPELKEICLRIATIQGDIDKIKRQAGMLRTSQEKEFNDFREDISHTMYDLNQLLLLTVSKIDNSYQI